MSEINDALKGQAAINNMINAISTTVKLSPYKSAELKNLQGSLLCNSGAESPLFNAVYSDDTFLKDPHQYFSEITQVFSATNSTFVWWWVQQSPVPENIQAELDNFGFQFLGQTVAIAKDLADINAKPLPDRVSIKEVMNENDYQLYVDIFSKMYHLTGSTISDFAAMYKTYGPMSNFKHYLAYYEDKPIAIMTSYIDGNTVGLYNGATLPEVQKKGISTALYLHAMLKAKELGCNLVITHHITPTENKGITDKFGFTPCCVLLPFIKVFKRPGIAMLFK